VSELADVLERLTREQLASIIEEAAEFGPKFEQVLRALVVYEVMTPEEQQRVHDVADELTDEDLAPWVRAVDGWE
jgi:hypothetical protein